MNTKRKKWKRERLNSKHRIVSEIWNGVDEFPEEKKKFCDYNKSVGTKEISRIRNTSIKWFAGARFITDS